jgi:hypothetical protein
VPKADGFGCLPLCKDLIDVLANAERVIEKFSEYDQPGQEGQIIQAGSGGNSETVHTGVSNAVVDPATGLSFALALFAASYTKRASRSR